MNTTPTASSTDEVTPAQTKEQGDDRYWIDHYRSVSSAVERTSTPASQDTKPHPRSPKRSATANPVKLTIFPPILNPNSASTPSPPTPDKDTSKAENDKLISIYPSEIISPSSSGPSDRNSAESPLKTVRFARTHIYHSSDSIITPTSLANYLEVPFTTATTLTRTQSDPKRERKGKHRADIKSRMTSDPLEIDITTGRSLPLRGDIPVRKMSSRSGSSKREERERSNSLRTREYGPPNVVRPIRPAARDVSSFHPFTSVDATLFNLHPNKHISLNFISYNKFSSAIFCRPRPSSQVDPIWTRFRICAAIIVVLNLGDKVSSQRYHPRMHAQAVGLLRERGP